MHFGLYLKKKGIITAAQLVDAIEAQHAKLVPIGQLALEEGILSARNIFDVLQEQSKYPHVRFGELAIEMGLMTRDHLMRLLMIQADRKRPIADILITHGVLTRDQVASELAAYRRAQGRPQVAATMSRARVVPTPRLPEITHVRTAEAATAI
jgi:hypothetical protein